MRGETGRPLTWCDRAMHLSGCDPVVVVALLCARPNLLGLDGLRRLGCIEETGQSPLESRLRGAITNSPVVLAQWLRAVP